MKTDRNLKLTELSWIDQCADQFEHLWRMGLRPRIDEFVLDNRSKIDESTPIQLIAELIKVDYAWRLRMGERPAVDDYLALLERSCESIKESKKPLNSFADRSNTVRPVTLDGSDRGQATHSLGDLTDDFIEDLVRDLNEIERHGNSCEYVRSISGSTPTDSSPKGGRDFTSAIDPESAIQPVSIGRFRLIRQIGKGSFSEVYMAKDVELNRQVAIKIPLLHQAPDANETKRIMREAQAAARLNHPGILKILDIVHYNDRPAIVSELLEGETLRGALQGKREFSPQESAKLARDLAEAIHYAHRSGVIHRDIKPSNVFLCRDRQPVILDFGLVQIDAAESLTYPGQILGTPAYMAPEQAAGRLDRVDARSDVYALGAVLFELLAGVPPFQGTAHRLIHQVLFDDPRPPAHYRGGIPVELATICLKAMDKSPARRYGSAGDLADDLQRFLESQPIQARRPNALRRCMRWCSRNSRVAGWGLALAAVLLVTTTAALMLSVAQSNHAIAEADARREVQVVASRNLAESGIGKLLADNPSGLFDLFKACRMVTDNPEEFYSRLLLLEQWLLEFEGQMTSLIDNPRGQSVHYSVDGSQIASCSNDGKIRIWNTESDNQQVLMLTMPVLSFATGVTFSPNGDEVIVTQNNGTAAACDLRVEAPGWLTAIGPGTCRSLQFADGDSGPTLIGAYEIEGKSLKTRFEVRKPGVADVQFDFTLPVMTHSKMTFNSDGSLLVIAGLLKEPGDTSASLVVVADMTTKQLRQATFDGLNAIPEFVVFGGEVNRLAVAWGGGRITAFDRQLQLLADYQHDEDVKHLALCRAGRRLASASFDSTVKVLDLNLDQPTQHSLTLKHGGPVLSIDFDSKGERIASGGFDACVRVFSVATGDLLDIFHHQDVVTGVQFHPSRSEVASISSDGTLRTWAIPMRARREHQVLTHPYRVWSVEFSSDGKQLLTTSQEGSAHIWNVASGQPVGTPVRVPSDLVSARFNPRDNRELLLTNLHSVIFHRLDGQPSPWDSNQVLSSFRQGRYSPDGRFALVSTDLAQFWLFELDVEMAGAENQAGSIVDNNDTRFSTPSSYKARLIQQASPVTDVAFHPNSRLFATGTRDGSVHIWSVDGVREVVPPLQHQTAIESIAFSPDGTTLAVSTRDMRIRLWNTADCSQTIRSFGGNGIVQSMAFSPCNRLLATASSTGMIRLWDVHTGLPAGPVMTHEMFATSVAFSPDGLWLASGAFDKTARLWSIPTSSRPDAMTPLEQLEQVEGRVQRVLGIPQDSLGNIPSINPNF